MDEPSNVIALRVNEAPNPSSEVHPMPAVNPRQCTARARSGARCRQQAVRGTTVCRMHGGTAPQVQRKARLRLLELIDPAITTLAREMTTAKASVDRQRAANSILDRAGFGRQNTAETEVARALLIDRLLQLRGEAK